MNDRTDPIPSEVRDPAGDAAPEVSVIVPAYRGLATIGACLESLRIAAIGHRCELIVVESSGDGAADLVRERFPEVRVIVSPARLSAGAARSEGFRHARGRWLLAVDQDCQVPREWITRLVELLGRPGVGAAGGSIAVANPGNLPGWCVYLLEFFTHFPSRGAVRDDNYLIGANSAWRAEAIRGGAFPDQTLGEDLLATAEMRRLGFDVLYDPALTVRHRNREGWREFLRYCRKMGAAAAHSQTRIGRRSIGVLHRFPFLAFGIPLLMLPRIGLALVGSPPRYLAMFLALLPACAVGQLAWANAFRKALPEARADLCPVGSR